MSSPSFDLAHCFSEPILFVSRSGRIRAANRAAMRDLHLSEEHLVGTALRELVESPRQEEIEDYLRACLRSREMIPGAVRIRGGDKAIEYRTGGCAYTVAHGEEPVLVLRLLPKATASTRFLALNEQITALTREIHRRREAEESLRQQREWFQVTLRSLGDGVIATDPAGRVTLVNQAAEGLTGWREDEARGQRLRDIFRIINEYSRQPVEDPVGQVIECGQIVGLANHTILIDRTGRERTIEDSAAPIKDAEGRLLGVVLVFHDISARRVVERELEQSRAQLQERLSDLEKFHDVVVGRELKMMELEAKVARLTRQLAGGQAPGPTETPPP